MYVMANDVRAVLTKTPDTPQGSAAELDDEAITAAITSAQSEVDSRLAARYVTPFPAGTAPQLVRDIVRDIAAYLADLVYRQGKDYESAQDPILLRHQRAQKLLDQITTGAVDLPAEAGQRAGGAVMRPHNRYTGRLFTAGDFHLGYVTGRRGPHY